MDTQNKAIILSDRGNIKTVFSYEQIRKMSKNMTDFFLENIPQHNCCIGLQMSHNMYLPSIILSLQELQHAFIFLTEEEPNTELFQDLGIEWILSFNINKNCVAKLQLHDHSLGLEKYPCKSVKEYKDIYYIMRTSGTTGDRKFIKVGKYSIESNIQCLSRIFTITSNDIIFFGTPLTFDPSMIELLLALHNNACLLITCENVVNPNALYETLFHPENGISVLQVVPSLFLRWSTDQIQNILLNKRLKILAFGGECFPTCLINYKRSETVRIFNLYGTTEMSCWASIYEVPINETIDQVSIGTALDDTIIEVRDASGNIIREGEGEIYIGSQNRMCFINNESSRNSNDNIFQATGDLAMCSESKIYYAGRRNDTFKRYGHKLHLSAIETMIGKETGLLNKCIWSKKSKLLVFLIIENYNIEQKQRILDKIQIKLLHSLPRQYFPDYVEIIRKCPLTSHGKTNIDALETLYLNRDYVSGCKSEILKSMFCKYFGLNEKQLLDVQKSTFFELGGNSVLAVQLLSEFNEAAGMQEPDLVTALFEKDIGTCLQCANYMRKDKNRIRIPKIDHITTKKVKNNIELKILWTYNLQACVDSSPLVFQHCEKTLVAVGSFSHYVAVLDVESGKEVAKFLLPDVIEAAPCISPCQKCLYVGCFDGCLYCLDFLDHSIKWIYATSDRIKCKPVLCQSSTTIVFGSYDKNVHCITCVNGSLIWKTNVEESVTATPLVRSGYVYIATICGTCLCLSESDGTIIWKYKTNSPIFGSPCAFGNVTMWPNVLGSVLSLTSDGKKIEEIQCSGHLFSSLITCENFIIFGCQNMLYIVEVDNDTARIKIKTITDLNNPLTTPCAYKNQIGIANNSGQLFLMNFDGLLLAEIQLPGDIFSSVIAHGNKLFVGCRDNNLYCIEIDQ